METFICENVFVPLRSGPSHKSEMLSQVLFGEKYQVIEQLDHWVKVKTLFDNYTGWMDVNHLQQTLNINDAAGTVLQKSLLCYKGDGTKLILEAGCEIYSPDLEKREFMLGGTQYLIGPDFADSHINPAGSIADTAMRFINAPYIWGGRIPSGIDCSGLSQLVYKLHGVQIPRDCRQQAETGTAISFLEETIPGDLVFFDNERGGISHVGIIISGGLVIHASGRVRIDTIDHQGIYKNEIRGYSHKLRTIRRIIGKPQV